MSPACLILFAALSAGVAPTPARDATTAARHSPPPTVVYRSFLETRFFQRGPEVAIKESRIMLAFAPPDAFKAVVRVWQGSTLLQEIPARVAGRAGTMAMLDYRATGVKLGPEEGARAIEVVVDGRVSGRFDFTLRKRSAGDAFDNTVVWEVDGPWREHILLEYDPAAPSPQRIFVRYWTSTLELPNSGRGTIEVRGRRGRQVLFSTYRTHVSAHEFLGFRAEAVSDGKRTPFSSEKLGALEGPLTVELLSGGVVLRAYETKIVNGTFAAHAHSELPPVAPLHFLSPREMSDRGTVSGGHHFWLTRP